MATKPESSRNILIAPLNWGLGHATRCFPIIRSLEAEGFVPVLASDGASLELLKMEFPHLVSLELPSYGISYSRNKWLLKWKMLLMTPKVLSAVIAEKRQVKKWVVEYDLRGIISDNRFGVFSRNVPSVYITHQVNVLSGSTTWLTSAIHRMIIRRFDVCWVPDIADDHNLSGQLGHHKNLRKLNYIGILSRFTKKETVIKHDLMVLLSGPEPHRSLLEEKLRLQLRGYGGNVIFVAGKISEQQEIFKESNITYYNFMLADELQQAISSSRIVVCRSGYSTIMDLVTLSKKAFFIPTPGQFEQEYLAKKLTADGLAPHCQQDDFELKMLNRVEDYSGFTASGFTTDLTRLYRLFEGKRKF